VPNLKKPRWTNVPNGAFSDLNSDSPDGIETKIFEASSLKKFVRGMATATVTGEENVTVSILGICSVDL
jgi:hypothetical protein